MYEGIETIERGREKKTAAVYTVIGYTAVELVVESRCIIGQERTKLFIIQYNFSRERRKTRLSVPVESLLYRGKTVSSISRKDK